MQIAIQISVIALMTAFVYALVALGFTLVFGIMRVVNFAHGEFYMLGAYSVYVFYGILGWNFGLALVVGALVVGLSGLLVERLLFRRFAGDEMGGMIVSLALAVCLQEAVALIFSVDDLTVERPVQGVLEIGGVFIALDQLVVVGVTLLVLVAFYLLIEKTRVGITIRAVAQDSEVARLQGVRSWRMTALTFGLSCLLAGIAGALMAPVYTINPHMGEMVVVKAFIIVVLGGLGSLPGAVVAALILSFTEAIASTFYNATVATMLSFLIVMAVLTFRPAGLMGRSR
ncbi:branched-chain amino acid ABC transporter permease (plasmid) [Diaphorobacter sp. HDW4B]|uniref:branched-chain amino acid ABC transporter permease n=1 Tax=Diaphorobacter sp. HDW4B TaxID=2714925 RepID=UPI00140AD5AD|nr:branched-chain amino acid ABC transporter permease [Diaphorobacter sp. HDW4B]QIL74062.1 branched-chain amino acid ABC transporter permease [Diaphorobacter sp. HDW4B]